MEGLKSRRLLTFGDLDTGFGFEGRLVTDFPGSSQDQITALVEQPDGKLLAAGTSTSEAILVRYTASGELDAAFGRWRRPHLAR